MLCFNSIHLPRQLNLFTLINNIYTRSTMLGMGYVCT